MVIIKQKHIYTEGGGILKMLFESKVIPSAKLKINGKTVIFKYPLSCIFVKVMYNGGTEEEYHEIEKSFR